MKMDLGTDHGTSAPVLLFGPPLLGSGIVGNHPSLSELDRAWQFVLQH